MIKVAMMVIKVKMINITVRSTSSALKKLEFMFFQSRAIQKVGSRLAKVSLTCVTASALSSVTSKLSTAVGA